MKNGHSHAWYPRQPSHLIKIGKKLECKTNNHMPLVSLGVQANRTSDPKLWKNGREHQLSGDHERGVAAEIQNGFQQVVEGLTRGSSSLTYVSPAVSAHPPAKHISNKSRGKRNLFNTTRIAKSADARKLRGRHAEEILTIGRTELGLPKDLGI